MQLPALNNVAVYLLGTLLLMSSCNTAAFAAGDGRAKEILRSVDDLWRGQSSYSVATMQVKTRHYTRNMRLEGWSKGKEQTLFRILEPKKEKGTATLKSGTNIYTYLPKTDRRVRLTSGMMMGNWMGSHITNDDLVKEARLEEDYDAHISFEGMRDGQEIIEFVLIPKPDAAVVWGKVVLEVRSDSWLPLRETFFDEDKEIARTFLFTDLRMLAGKPRPAVMRVVPADKPGEFTEFVYQTLELDIEISDRFFSLSNLRKR